MEPANWAVSRRQRSPPKCEMNMKINDTWIHFLPQEHSHITHNTYTLPALQIFISLCSFFPTLISSVYEERPHTFSSNRAASSVSILCTQYIIDALVFFQTRTQEKLRTALSASCRRGETTWSTIYFMKAPAFSQFFFPCSINMLTLLGAAEWVLHLLKCSYLASATSL